MGVSLWINRGHVYLSLCYGGRQWRESTGLKADKVTGKMTPAVRKMAEAIREQREIQMSARRFGLEALVSRQTLLEYAAETAEESGSVLIKKSLVYLEEYGGGLVLVTGVTARWFETFQRNLENSGLSLSTAERYCCAVRTVLSRAVRDGIIDRNPADLIKHIRVPETVKEALTADEVRAMVNCHFSVSRMDVKLQDNIRRGFLFACCTGLRVSDILQLEWGHLDFERMTLAKKQQKTQNVVYVPLKKEAAALIADGKEHAADELVFPELSASNTKTNRFITKWAEAAGVKKHVTWHTARHTEATLLIEYGADVYTVQRILGHTKIETTMRYAKVSDHKKREAVDNMPDFGIMDEQGKTDRNG
jgi:site-specific recombinase XerD